MSDLGDLGEGELDRVSRPKIETRTLSFWPSTLTSLIVAGSVANGRPSR
jgi:hypothetical protein